MAALEDVSGRLAELERQVDPEIMALLEGDLEEALEARVEVEVEGLLQEAKGELDEELGGRLKELLGDG